MAGIRFSSKTSSEAFILISPVVQGVYIADRKMSKDTRRKHSETIYQVLEEEAGKKCVLFSSRID